MFDSSVRSVWLREQLWPKLREAFPIASLPLEAFITIGYPSSGARGRSEKIRPCEINHQWTGNVNEQVFISVHPVYCDSPENIAKAILFQAAKVTMGHRWGPVRVGLDKHDDASIHAVAETQRKIDAIIADIGTPPEGHAVPFAVRDVQRARMLQYHCDQKCTVNYGTKLGFNHPKIRAASEGLNVTCKDCGGQYSLG